MVNYPDTVVFVLIAYQLSQTNSQSNGAEKSCDNTNMIRAALQDSNAFNSMFQLLALDHPHPGF